MCVGGRGEGAVRRGAGTKVEKDCLPQLPRTSNALRAFSCYRKITFLLLFIFCSFYYSCITISVVVMVAEKEMKLSLGHFIILGTPMQIERHIQNGTHHIPAEICSKFSILS